jgi:asparagine synthase (glutamine-hydrolysing)
MCGIAGFWDAAGATPALQNAGLAAAGDLSNLAARMAQALSHRGPDDAGVWQDPSCGLALGFRRLSILDLSASGHQPMVSANGRFVIAFNGEIYNFSELRRALDAEHKIAWRGHSDTEVLLEAIAHWGVLASLQKLNGMFALALWDTRQRELWLARDRMGEKPLYYGRQGSALLFGSELKALKTHPAWLGEIDGDALGHYFRHGYVPGPRSAYRDVAKLPPGSFVRITAQNAHAGAMAAPEFYWHARARATDATPFGGDAVAAADQLAELIRNSVAMRMIADVPVGAFLSGGIDSSAVVAAMQAQAPGRVKTFSIGFPDDAYNEAPYAAAVAKHLGTEHTELNVSEAECLATLPRLAGIYDEPFADASAIPTLLLCELTRRQVTVGLSGDGGDELFGGYARYWNASQRWMDLQKIPAPLRGLARTLQPMGCWRGLGRVGLKLQRGLEGIGARDASSLYRLYTSLWRDGDGLTRMPPPGKSMLPARPSLAQEFMLIDAETYLPDDLLVKIDRASMFSSLEARAALLDHRLVEFSWSLPADYLVRDGQAKWLLRQVLYRSVPQALVDRPKMGFEAPIARWLRTGLRDWAEELLSERALGESGIIAAKPVRRRWHEHVTGRHNWSNPLWAVLMFQSWWKTAR